MASELERLRSELRLLQEQYSILQEEKAEIERLYAHDRRKWKRFKKWVLLGDYNVHEKKGNTASFAIDEYKSLQYPRSTSLDRPGNPRDSDPQQSEQCDIPSFAITRNVRIRDAHSPASPTRNAVTNTLTSLDDSSLNSRYRLNPTRNEGLDFQFDEIVRHKHDRNRLGAEDCECCRDYYNTVAPLPLPLQPPLWRSPTSTPTKRRCPSDQNNVGATNITREQSEASHVQKISRHRRRWEAPKTPPGYWDIGFPDTQETERINKRAREMHAQKILDVEAEAGIGGRYVRR